MRRGLRTLLHWPSFERCAAGRHSQYGFMVMVASRCDKSVSLFQGPRMLLTILSQSPKFQSVGTALHRPLFGL